VFVLSRVAALRRADPLSKESYRHCKRDYGTEEQTWAQQRALEPIMNELLKSIPISSWQAVSLVSVLLIFAWLILRPEDEGDIFLRNAGRSPNYRPLKPADNSLYIHRREIFNSNLMNYFLNSV
jgi:hypothetical protein